MLEAMSGLRCRRHEHAIRSRCRETRRGRRVQLGFSNSWVSDDRVFMRLGNLHLVETRRLRSAASLVAEPPCSDRWGGPLRYRSSVASCKICDLTADAGGGITSHPSLPPVQEERASPPPQQRRLGSPLGRSVGEDRPSCGARKPTVVRSTQADPRAEHATRPSCGARKPTSCGQCDDPCERHLSLTCRAGLLGQGRCFDGRRRRGC